MTPSTSAPFDTASGASAPSRTLPSPATSPTSPELTLAKPCALTVSTLNSFASWASSSASTVRNRDPPQPLSATAQSVGPAAPTPGWPNVETPFNGAPSTPANDQPSAPSAHGLPFPQHPRTPSTTPTPIPSLHVVLGPPSPGTPQRNPPPRKVALSHHNHDPLDPDCQSHLTRQPSTLTFKRNAFRT